MSKRTPRGHWEIEDRISTISLSEFESCKGDYGFHISFHPGGEPTKSVPWTYSTILDHLFVSFNMPCPIQFHFSSPPPMGSLIRVFPLFKGVEWKNYEVDRCLVHSQSTHPSNSLGNCPPEYLIRCTSSSSCLYERCARLGDRRTIAVPLEALEKRTGSDDCTMTLSFNFCCFNSCVGGINRRTTLVSFTLEYEGEVLGRHVMDLRICACPGRDRKNLEKRYLTDNLARSNQHLLKGRSNLQAVEVYKGNEKMSSVHLSIQEACSSSQHRSLTQGQSNVQVEENSPVHPSNQEESSFQQHHLIYSKSDSSLLRDSLTRVQATFNNTAPHEHLPLKSPPREPLQFSFQPATKLQKVESGWSTVLVPIEQQADLTKRTEKILAFETGSLIEEIELPVKIKKEVQDDIPLRVKREIEIESEMSENSEQGSIGNFRRESTNFELKLVENSQLETVESSEPVYYDPTRNEVEQVYKKAKLDDEEDEDSDENVYYLTVRGTENYKIIQKVYNALRFSDLQKKPLRKSQH